MKQIVILTGLFVLTSLVISSGNVETEMRLNKEGYFSYDHFVALLNISNTGDTLPDVQIFGILEIYGDFYFWPSFTHDVDFQYFEIQTGENEINLLEFELPDISSLNMLGPWFFWGAWYVNPEEYGFDIAQFWFGEPFSPPDSFKFIPSGSFDIGSPVSEPCHEENENQQTVIFTKPFYINDTEVTQMEWEEVFGTNPSEFLDPSHPVENISWFDAVIYCNRLSLSDGLKPCYYSDPEFSEIFDETPPVISGEVYWNQDVIGFRLLTQAEWEYACRATTTTGYNMNYNTDCWEDPYLEPLAWYEINASNTTHPVGQKAPNLWELYDMHGNVWEWTWNWWAERYPKGPVTDPTGPAIGVNRVLRGGSWNCHARCCRSADRIEAPMDTTNSDFGFRIGMSIHH